MRYTDLDPTAQYKIRVVYGGDSPRQKIRLIANGATEIHPFIVKPAPYGPIEFDVQFFGQQRGVRRRPDFLTDVARRFHSRAIWTAEHGVGRRSSIRRRTHRGPGRRHRQDARTSSSVSNLGGLESDVLVAAEEHHEHGPRHSRDQTGNATPRASQLRIGVATRTLTHCHSSNSTKRVKFASESWTSPASTAAP